MNVVFRVDASRQIGTGHVVRCRTLALALRKRGAGVKFVCRTHPGHLMDWLAQDGIPCTGLRAAPSRQAAGSADYAAWLGVPQSDDACETLEAIGDERPDWLIADHYGLDAAWERQLKPRCGRLLVIDDLANRPHDCDVLLDQNLYPDYGKRYDGVTPAECQLLLGPKYALLRDEFRELRTKARCRSAPGGRILVFFGGVDALNCTGCAIEAIARLGAKDIAADVVIGLQHPRREDIEFACDRYGFVCHVQTSRMAELMAAADLALGAGGSASWERCCLGLPSILTAAADNQIAVCRTLAGTGAADYLGEAKELGVADWQAAIAGRLQSPWLAMASSRAWSLVDGLGVSRALAEMGLE